jgi:hypothetical protein
MALTPEQHAQIAVTYDTAANDERLPMQHRRAFAKKANWFRMVARVAAKKKETAAFCGGSNLALPELSQPKKRPFKAFGFGR